MSRRRIGLLPLILIVALIALNLAVIRALRYDPGSNQERYYVPIDATTSIPFVTLALGVLPMASVLVLASMGLIRGSLRTRTVSASWLGFVVFGWISVFVYMCCTALSPGAVQKCLLAIERPFGPAILAMIGNSPAQWRVDAVEISLALAIFLTPQLAIAMAGAWLIGRSVAGSARVSLRDPGADCFGPSLETRPQTPVEVILR